MGKIQDRATAQYRRFAHAILPPGFVLHWPLDPSVSVRNTSDFYAHIIRLNQGANVNACGLDIAPEVSNDPAPIAIHPSAPGTVVDARDAGSWGNMCRIDHGNGLRTLYAHLESLPLYAVGHYVYPSDAIGYMGNTGSSTGKHLHFQVERRRLALFPNSYTPADPELLLEWTPWVGTEPPMPPEPMRRGQVNRRGLGGAHR